MRPTWQHEALRQGRERGNFAVHLHGTAQTNADHGEADDEHRPSCRFRNRRDRRNVGADERGFASLTRPAGNVIETPEERLAERARAAAVDLVGCPQQIVERRRRECETIARQIGLERKQRIVGQIRDPIVRAVEEGHAGDCRRHAAVQLVGDRADDAVDDTAVVCIEGDTAGEGAGRSRAGADVDGEIQVHGRAGRLCHPERAEHQRAEEGKPFDDSLHFLTPLTWKHRSARVADTAVIIQKASVLSIRAFRSGCTAANVSCGIY